jgi:hypothetical protein
MARVAFTRPMADLMAGLGLGGRLGVDLGRSSMLITEADLDMLLVYIPRSGHTGMALRRRVANAKAKLILQRAKERA